MRNNTIHFQTHSSLLYRALKPVFIVTFLLGMSLHTRLLAQVSSTPELASIVGVQQEIEELTNMVITHWDPDLPIYQEVMKKYIRLRRNFTETTLYMSHYYGLSKRKQKKETDNLKKKIEDLSASSNEYFDFINENDTEEVKSRGSRGFILSFISHFIKNPELIGTALDEIISLFSSNSDRYAEVIAMLNSLQLRAWHEVELEIHPR